MTRLSPPLQNHKATSHHRPTLPSLASLRLPDIRRPTSNLPPLRPSNVMNVPNANANDLLAPIPLNFNEHWQRPRQSSVSSESSATSESSVTSTSSISSFRSIFNRSPSPELGIIAVGPPVVSYSKNGEQNLRRYHPTFDSTKHRIALWHRFEDADAMLIMPLGYNPLDENFIPRYDTRKPSALTGRPFILFGPPAWRLRNPHMRKGVKAAVYPYRILSRSTGEPLPPKGPIHVRPRVFSQPPPAPALAPAPAHAHAPAAQSADVEMRNQ
ncbi:hypothetical protein ONZ51_g12549 [Trametes cubensis]|uniref:Uncharacterized protein n=1 Tax=Trametes cubensis TaxID=1111947 RepID=A0AAD7TIA4_9APHY|nr:hypothetical protein ONZ51_g12549 [Trametes cubensis]